MVEPGGSGTALVGRDAELAALAAFLESVKVGSASLVASGEAGQGKSSLLAWTAAAAERQGMQVLRATGIEFERELAFGGLVAVLRPLLGRLDGLSEAQRDALRVATGLVIGDASTLVTYGATLALLSSAADAAPVVVVIDDAQWMDRASLEALLFAACRAGADRVGFAFAQRVGVPCLLDDVGFHRIELGGLSADAAVALLGQHGVAPAVARRCWRMTSGNPLALVEGARGLTPGQRSGQEALPPALPVAARLLDSFRSHLDGLPDATVRALGLAALETTDDLTTVAAALKAVGADPAVLEPAERRRLVYLAGGQVTWCHPLLRSAVYRRVGSEWRRQSHRVLAAVAQAGGRDEEALWHLSETVFGPDDAVASQMAALGRAALRRGAMRAAAEAHRRAAGLWTEPADADREILAAARALNLAGDLVGVAELLGPRIDTVAAVETQAEMGIVLGLAELWTVGSAVGVERFEHHAAAVGDTRPDLAAILLLHAAPGRMVALDVEGAVETTTRAMAIAERSGDATTLFGASCMQSLARVFAGAGDEVVDQLGPMSQLLTAALQADVQQVDDAAQLCALALLACERSTQAIDMLNLVIRSGDRTGAMGRSAFGRLLLAEALWRAGRWAESLAELSQSVALQEAVPPGRVVPGTLALLARVEAALGRAESCRSHVEQVLRAPPDVAMFEAVALSATGLLELGLGRGREAAAAFDRVCDLADPIGEPGWLWWRADAVEAYAASGRTGDARRALERLELLAEATGRAWARAAAARGRGLLGRGDEADAELTAALDCFRSLGAPFEEARTLLVRGQRRIGLGRREVGAHDVAAARTIFDRLGARTWSERTSTIRGEASRADDALTARLTPAELRVAMVVGRGTSNREAADRLFISTKTVDYHLQSIYRKLGLRSRTQLMTLVLSEAGTAS